MYLQLRKSVFFQHKTVFMKCRQKEKSSEPYIPLNEQSVVYNSTFRAIDEVLTVFRNSPAVLKVRVRAAAETQAQR
jgi:hypothetical protein